MHLETKDWMGLATGTVAVLAAVIAAIRYFVKKEQLEGDTQRLQKQFDELDASHKELKQVLGSIKLAGTAALALKSDMDVQLEEAMRAVQARASSILVPLPGKNASNLVFLCVLAPPETVQTVRRSLVPIGKGIAGYVFQTGKPYFASDARTDNKFFKGIDVISSYTTRDILCVPICKGSATLGVVQFLNKSSGDFDQQDLDVAHRFASQLSARVSEFLADDKNFELLGSSQIEQAVDATILFCDLTASTQLLDSINFTAAINLINSYVEKSCDIALRRGGTVDKILGDGAMMCFNVPRSIPDSRLEAMQAAIEMRDAFERQKATWLSAGMPVSTLFTRIGIAAGPVRQTILGHPQFQSITVVGEPVILASNLCAGAPRDRSVVLATAETVRNFDQSITARSIPASFLKKIKGEQTAVVELLAYAPPSRDPSRLPRF